MSHYCYVLNCKIPLKSLRYLPDAFVSKGDSIHRKISVLAARVVSLEDQAHREFDRVAKDRPWEADENLRIERSEVSKRLCEVVYSMAGMVALRDRPDYDPIESQAFLGRHLARCSTHVYAGEADLEAFYVFPEERKPLVEALLRPLGMIAGALGGYAYATEYKTEAGPFSEVMERVNFDSVRPTGYRLEFNRGVSEWILEPSALDLLDMIDEEGEWQENPPLKRWDAYVGKGWMLTVEAPDEISAWRKAVYHLKRSGRFPERRIYESTWVKPFHPVPSPGCYCYECDSMRARYKRDLGLGAWIRRESPDRDLRPYPGAFGMRRQSSSGHDLRWSASGGKRWRRPRSDNT